MRRTLSALALAIAALPAAGSAAAQTAFAPAVIVNDEVVTNYDIAQRARLLVVNGARAEPERLRAIAVEQLIEDRLKRSAAERRGLALPQEALDEAVASYAQQRGLSLAELDRLLASQGASRGALESALGTDLLWRETIRGRFGGRAEPTDAEIDQEIALAASGRATAYRIAEIVLPFAARGEDRTRALAARLSRDLDGAGAEAFAESARRYSASASAREGGEVGWVQEETLPAAAAGALGGLAPGDVSAPLEIPGGIALLKVLDSRAEGADFAAETRLDLLALSAPSGEAGALRDAAGGIVDDAPDCARAEELAAAVGLRARRRAETPLSALPRAAAAALAGLSPGQATPPLDLDGDETVLLLCARSGGPGPEVRERLRDEIRSQRLERFAAGYLDELRADAVIERR